MLRQGLRYGDAACILCSTRPGCAARGPPKITPLHGVVVRKLVGRSYAVVTGFHLRGIIEKRFAPPDPAGGAGVGCAGAANCAYMLCASRGDCAWWSGANALGDVAPTGKSPYAGPLLVAGPYFVV